VVSFTSPPPPALLPQSRSGRGCEEVVMADFNELSRHSSGESEDSQSQFRATSFGMRIKQLTCKRHCNMCLAIQSPWIGPRSAVVTRCSLSCSVPVQAVVLTFSSTCASPGSGACVMSACVRQMNYGSHIRRRRLEIVASFW
jgi:hypothetical protein